jgi:uncharacterized protein YkwD
VIFPRLSRLLFLIFVSAIGALAGSCTSEVVVESARNGVWVGAHVDFRVCDGVVSGLRVKDVSCIGTSKGDGAVGTPCSRAAEELIPGMWSLDEGRLNLAVDALEIEGAFTEPERFVGVYRLVDPSCCGVLGDLTASWLTATGGCGGADVVDEPVSSDSLGDAEVAGDLSEVEVIAGDPAERALILVNERRLAVGTHLLTADARLQEAATAHAEFVVANFALYQETGLSVHEEDASWDGFTGETFGDRVRSFGYELNSGWEIIAFYDDPDAAMDAWMQTLYHRIPILHPNAWELGYGRARTDGSSSLRIDVMDFGGTYESASSEPTLWPYPEQQGVPTQWDGLENPQPPLPEGEGYPSGPVVTISFPFLAVIEAESFELRDDEGALVPTQWLYPPRPNPDPGPGADPFLQSSHALLPLDPLEPGLRYELAFRATVDGSPYERVWTFKTAESSP